MGGCCVCSQACQTQYSPQGRPAWFASVSTVLAITSSVHQTSVSTVLAFTSSVRHTSVSTVLAFTSSVRQANDAGMSSSHKPEVSDHTHEARFSSILKAGFKEARGGGGGGAESERERVHACVRACTRACVCVCVCV